MGYTTVWLRSLTTVWLRSLNKHKGLRKLFELGNTSGVQSQYSKRIKRILALLETAGTIEDMDLPDLKLHELRGFEVEYGQLK